MKATNKTLAWLAAAALLVALVIAVSFLAFRQIEQAAEIQKHTNKVLNSADDLLSAIKDAETGQRGYLLTGDDTYLQPYLMVRNNVSGQLQQLRQLTLLSAAHQHLDALAPLLDAKLQHMSLAIELRRKQGIAASLAPIRSGKGKQLMDAIRAEMGSFIQLEENALRQRDAELQSSMRRLFAIIVGASLLTLLFALAFAWLFYRETQQQVKNLLHLETLHLLKAQEETNKQLQLANLNLQLSEEKFAVTLNSIGDAVIATDSEARVTLLNPLAEQLTGWTQAQASGRPVDEIFIIVNKETRLPATIPVRETLEHGTVQGLANHTVLIAVDGSEYDIADSCAPIRTRDGDVIGAVLVFRNVTEEYAVQQALRDSAAQIQAILNTVVDGIITLHARDGIIETVNPAAERMFGYTSAELPGQNFSLLIPELDQYQSNGSLEYYSASDEARASGLGREVSGRRKDGSTFPLEIAVSEMWLDGQYNLTCILRDISTRKQVDDKVRTAAQYARSLIEASLDPLVTISPEGKITDVNAGSINVTGVSREKLVGTDFSNYFTEPDKAREGYQQVFAKGFVTDYPLTIRHQDGRLTDVLYNASVYKDVQGNVLGVFAAARDVTDQKQASQYARSLIEASLDPLVTISPEGKITDVNEGSIKVTGVPREQLIGTDFSNYFTEPGKAREGYQQVFAKGFVTDYPLTIRHQDGRLTDVLYNASVYKDVEGNVLGVFAAARDITARKQAEAALLKAGALQNAIFNSANFSSIATDAKGVIQIYNVGAERMLGYSAAEVMNKITPAEISDPQEVIARARALSVELGTAITPGFEALVFKASRGIEDIYELNYIRKDGSRFPAVVSVTALRDNQNAIIGYLLIGTDNTARIKVEAERQKLDQRLRDQQFYTRSLIESSIDALITTDPSGIISDANKQMEILTGCTRDELIGSSFKKYFTDAERAEAGIKRVLDEKKVTDYELTARARNGKESVVSYNATTFYDRNRKLQGVFAVARDITERKRLDQMLLDKNAELERARTVAEKANLAKSDFLSSMSHELRTPLNAILGFAQLLDAGKPAPTETQSLRLHQILKAGWYLLELINEILDLAAIEYGKLALSREPVSLIEVMRECEALIESQAKSHAIRVTFAPFDPGLFVNADRTRVKQIMVNLISNAIKYNRQHGTVEIACAQSSADTIRISVNDSGAGLTAEKIEHLFQPFNRLGQESGTEEGTGIGLAVCKKLVELMGGTIGVKSTVGVGSEFWFKLIGSTEPVADGKNTTLANNAQQGRINKAEKSSTHTLTLTLLYVEDNPANLLLVEQTIGEHPHIHLLSAHDGLLGIELARAHLPDVILMDINLPGISGIETLKRLRADPATANIPVIAISANAMLEDIERCLSAGFFRYLTKPVIIHELLDTLDKALKFSEKGLDNTHESEKIT